MYEYGIRHITTGEQDIIFGYSFEDACRRSNLNPREWVIDTVDYID